MNIAQIENNLQTLVKSFDKNTHPDQFIYDLLLAYGKPNSTIKRLKLGDRNLSKNAGEIEWKKQLFYKAIAPNTEDLHALIERLKTAPHITKLAPRFIIITDFETLLAIDCKTSDTLDIPLLMLAKHYDFFLPWAGMEKANHQNENPADVKAAEKMAKLFDAIKKDNPDDSPDFIHGLNVFLSRLLFCFFAEDTGILEDALFTNSISSHTQPDGSDLNTYLDTLFQVMNTKDRNPDLPAYLNAFPYVNGGLFRNHHPAPIFTRSSRQAIIEAGTLNWSEINPDIFGSMIQAVITPEHRGGLGMHYTSVPNIMKVIEPLFLNELYDAFEAIKAVKENNKQLSELLSRIYKIKIFDPACGSGNFLIIAYKELRQLEMKIFKAQNSLALSNISLGNFYGIELDDFAHEVATLSLWLAEHQMNQLFFKEFGRTKPALPLMETGNIAHGNACRLDWESVCPKHENDEIYILGNPPYLGTRNQKKEHKNDVEFVLTKINNYKTLDYIACWFYKASDYIQGINAVYSFVTTNSICQGEQVALLWPHILNKSLEIGFAYTSFKWANSARANAGVTVLIIGIRNKSNNPKYFIANNLIKKASNINPYIVDAPNIIVKRSSQAISNLPKMIKGSIPADGGHLLLNQAEYNTLSLDHRIKPFLKEFIGAQEIIDGINRWCLYVDDSEIKELTKIEEIKKRLNFVSKMRQESTKIATQKLANYPHKFAEDRYYNEPCILIPCVTSEKREYIPIAFISKEPVIYASAQAIYSPETWVFSVITSKMHMAWMRAVCGRLKSDYRYSSSLVYNTFPFPMISEQQKEMLKTHALNVINAREHNSGKTLAQLYDPDKMPDQLREAHHQLDLAVESCYRSKPFENDEERLAYLFKLYEEMIEGEK